MPKKIDIDSLIEQTEFLFKTQKEAKTSVDSLYTEFLNAVDQKLKASKTGKQADIDQLENIYNLVSERTTSMSEEMQEDIDFLADQLSYLKNLKTMEDKGLAAELLEEATRDLDEMEETSVFKKQITQDYAESKKELVMVIKDLKDALGEGNLDEIEAAFETVLMENEEDEEDDDECGGCHKDDAKDSCCGSSCHAKKHGRK